MNSSSFGLRGRLPDLDMGLLADTLNQPEPVRMTYGEEKPPEPQNGDTHLDNSSGTLHVYDGKVWNLVK